MQKLILALAITLISMSSFAQENFGSEVQIQAKRWRCEATGQALGGGIGGGLWQTVFGYGDDERSAAQDALGRCYGMGYRQCRLGYCFRH